MDNFKFNFLSRDKLESLQSTRFTHERTTSNIHKIFHSPIWFFKYEMILRTFNCTIVNQIKSSKKLEVKLKIRICSYYRWKLFSNYFSADCRCFRAGTNEWLCHCRVAFLKYALVCSWFHVLKPRMSRNFLGGFYQKRLLICTIME